MEGLVESRTSSEVIVERAYQQEVVGVVYTSRLVLAGMRNPLEVPGRMPNSQKEEMVAHMLPEETDVVAENVPQNSLQPWKNPVTIVGIDVFPSSSASDSLKIFWCKYQLH